MARRLGSEGSTIVAGGLSALLYRSKRRTLCLQLGRDRELILRAPYGVPDAFLRDFLERRRAWVERSRARMERRSSSAWKPRWASGERLPYLGGELELRVERGGPCRARMEAGAIVASVADPSDTGLIQRAVERLYAREAAARFPALLDACLARPAARGIPKPELRFRSMRSRWGSCDPGRRIVTLNTNLVRQSPQVICYVIMHELAHLWHRRHDEDFYELLARLCPDWEELRARLAAVRTE